MKRPGQDAIDAWRRLLPGWKPTLAQLNALDEKSPEFTAAIRAMTRDWTAHDARWDTLVAVVEYVRRDHAHELAEKIRSWHDRLPGEHECCDGNAAELIDPEKEASDGS